MLRKSARIRDTLKNNVLTRLCMSSVIVDGKQLVCYRSWR